jgi:hypothetical protein
MGRRRLRAVDVKRSVMDAYNAELAQALGATVWASGCRSYFTNEHGKIATQLPYPSLWYWRRTRWFRIGDYERHGRRPSR